MKAKFDLNSAWTDNRIVGTFGIDYLDSRLKGISRGDLVLIGARSGAGKSSIANTIASHNAGRGTKIALFSLENFENDLQLEKAYYFYVKHTRNYQISLREFATGEVKNRADFNEDIAFQAQEFAQKAFEGISIYHRQKGFTVEALSQAIAREVRVNHVELIVLDHLDYVDKFNDAESDVTHVSCLMKSIRELQDEFKIAVIAISHLRKPANSREKMVIPSMDEFIGSSNKVKEATVVIVFAPDDETNQKNLNHSKATFCAIRKLRLGGIDNTCARLYFNARTGRYDDFYDLMSCNYAGTVLEAIGGR